MATTYPTGTAADTSTMTTVIGILALIAIIALVYFISRGTTGPSPAITPEKPATEQAKPAGAQP